MKGRMFFYENKPVGADAETPVANIPDLLRGKGISTRPVIDQDEIITGGLILMEMYFHDDRSNR
jgi:hypothetical protein